MSPTEAGIGLLSSYVSHRSRNWTPIFICLPLKQELESSLWLPPFEGKQAGFPKAFVAPQTVVSKGYERVGNPTAQRSSVVTQLTQRSGPGAVNIFGSCPRRWSCGKVSIISMGGSGSTPGRILPNTYKRHSVSRLAGRQTLWSIGTSWPGISVFGEIVNLISIFCLSVVARRMVLADPSLK